jgi:hypothetical protein
MPWQDYTGQQTGMQSGTFRNGIANMHKARHDKNRKDDSACTFRGSTATQAMKNDSR